MGVSADPDQISSMPIETVAAQARSMLHRWGGRCFSHVTHQRLDASAAQPSWYAPNASPPPSAAPSRHAPHSTPTPASATRRDAPDTDLKRHGRKLAKSGSKISKRIAKVAVARKLAVLLHTPDCGCWT